MFLHETHMTASFLIFVSVYTISIYSFLEMLFCISLSEKLSTKVNAVNIPWNTRQYINTSHIPFMYARYFFFQTIVLNIDSVNLIIYCLYENEKNIRCCII